MGKIELKEGEVNGLLLSLMIIWLVALGFSIDGFMSYKVKMDTLASCVLPISFLVLVRFFSADLKNIHHLWIAYIIIAILQIFTFYKWGWGNILISRFYALAVCFLFASTIGIKSFLYHFESAVVLLTKISIILVIIVELFPFVHNLLTNITFPPNGSVDFTIGIVGITKDELGSNMYDNGFLIRRNTGFAWEPGRFAATIVVALLINLYRNKFQLFKKNFLILVIGLLSTQSTTGLFAALVCVVGYYINNKSVNKKKVSPIIKFTVIGGLIAFIFLSPFMVPKLQKIMNRDNWLDVNNTTVQMEDHWTPQRIEGLFLESLNIADSPVVGYGEKVELSYVRRVLFPYLEIFLSNGLLSIIASLGIPVAFFFYLCLWKSSKMLSELYQVKGEYLFFILLCMINVSYDLFKEPLIMYMSLSSFFINSKDQIQWKKLKSQ